MEHGRSNDRALSGYAFFIAAILLFYALHEGFSLEG
jgi:hypothetical protein